VKSRLRTRKILVNTETFRADLFLVKNDREIGDYNIFSQNTLNTSLLTFGAELSAEFIEISGVEIEEEENIILHFSFDKSAPLGGNRCLGNTSYLGTANGEK
jgi:hypothetical protein